MSNKITNSALLLIAAGVFFIAAQGNKLDDFLQFMGFACIGYSLLSFFLPLKRKIIQNPCSKCGVEIDEEQISKGYCFTCGNSELNIPAKT